MIWDTIKKWVISKLLITYNLVTSSYDAPRSRFAYYWFMCGSRRESSGYWKGNWNRQGWKFFYIKNLHQLFVKVFIQKKDYDEIYKEAQMPRVPQIGPFLTLTTKPLVGCDNLLSVKVMANQSNKYWRNISAIQQYRYKSTELPNWCLHDVPFLVWVVYLFHLSKIQS